MKQWNCNKCNEGNKLSHREWLNLYKSDECYSSPFYEVSCQSHTFLANSFVGNFCELFDYS